MGKKMWTDEAIRRELLKIAQLYEPPRMPTNYEMIEISGNYKLASAIQRNGGFEYWAEQLQLPMIPSETIKGQKAEKRMAKMIEEHGLKVKLTSFKFPYDLLVQNCIKVDVKTACISYVRGYPIHAYRLGKTMPTCDFYICCEDETDNYYVIPAHICTGQQMIEMGLESRKYEPYRMAMHLIQKACKFYTSIEQ